MLASQSTTRFLYVLLIGNAVATMANAQLTIGFNEDAPAGRKPVERPDIMNGREVPAARYDGKTDLLGGAPPRPKSEQQIRQEKLDQQKQTVKQAQDEVESYDDGIVTRINAILGATPAQAAVLRKEIEELERDRAQALQKLKRKKEALQRLEYQEKADRDVTKIILKSSEKDADRLNELYAKQNESVLPNASGDSASSGDYAKPYEPNVIRVRDRDTKRPIVTAKTELLRQDATKLPSPRELLQMGKWRDTQYAFIEWVFSTDGKCQAYVDGSPGRTATWSIAGSTVRFQHRFSKFEGSISGDVIRGTSWSYDGAGNWHSPRPTVLTHQQQ
ncbi:MAG: hypothetical protein KDA89_16055 [Planctomycetaceae bacterium]|nr:hypothetical protein [Planctomycetaceae bacterium]